MQKHTILIKLALSMSLFIVSSIQTPSVALEQTTNTEQVKSTSYKQRMQNTVEHWKKEIGRDKQFSAFADAYWEVQPLGPGTHSFLVLFFNPNKEQADTIGYLIIHETLSGELEIGEYGKGLYEGLSSLYESPFTTVYHHPLEAIYIDEQHNAFDFFTNEMYPLEDISIKEETVSDISHDPFTLQDDAILNYSLYTAYFSPYEKLPWLSSPSINNEFLEDRSIETDIELEQALYYRVKSWENKISTVFAVTSIHKWNNNKLYIGLQLEDKETTRYLPFEQLLKYGKFYSS